MKFLDKWLLIGQGKGRYGAMEGLRAYAALLVFFVHSIDEGFKKFVSKDLNAVSWQSIDNGPEAFFYWLFKSHYGVDLFFLLSGFLVYRMIQKEGFTVVNFLWHRVLRIYPAFLVSLIAAVFVMVELLSWRTYSVADFTLNMFFLNGVPGSGVVPYNWPTWSLFFEFAFYAICPILLLISKNRMQAFLLVMCVMLFFLAGNIILMEYIRFEMFLMGSFLASFSDQQLKVASAKLPDMWVLIAYVVSGLIFVVNGNLSSFVAVYMLASSALFITSIYGGGFLSHFFSLRWFKYLGNVSYSFYLFHVIVICIIVHGSFGQFLSAIDIGLSIKIGICMLISFVLTLVAAIVSFICFEKPYFYFAHKARTRSNVGQVKVV